MSVAAGWLAGWSPGAGAAPATRRAGSGGGQAGRVLELVNEDSPPLGRRLTRPQARGVLSPLWRPSCKPSCRNRHSIDPATTGRHAAPPARAAATAAVEPCPRGLCARAGGFPSPRPSHYGPSLNRESPTVQTMLLFALPVLGGKCRQLGRPLQIFRRRGSKPHQLLAQLPHPPSHSSFSRGQHGHLILLAQPTSELGNFIMPATEALAGHWSTKLRANVARPTSTALNPVHRVGSENNARRSAGKGSLPRWSPRAGPPVLGEGRVALVIAPRVELARVRCQPHALRSRPAHRLALLALRRKTTSWKSLAE